MTLSEQSNTPMYLRYFGTNRDGQVRVGTGVADETAAEIAKRLFDLRFRSAEIRNAVDRQIGGVSQNEVGVRIWWGESSS